MAVESDPQFESIAPPLQSRRLRLRNAHVHASPLPAGPPYYSGHRRRRSSSSSARPQIARAKTTGNAIEDYGWESEEDDAESTEDPQLVRRHTYNAATSALLAPSTTGYGRSSSRGVSPSYAYGNGASSKRNRSRDGSRHDTSYIEYLEKQLAEVTTQLQNVSNPTANTSQAAKLRKLTEETKHLKGEIEEWETRYELTVKEHTAGIQQQERTLRAEIQKLETKLEAAEEHARVANQNLQKLKKRCEELEGVEQENKTLEFRIQALSELLADSARAIQPSPSITSGRTSIVYTGRTGPLSDSSEHAVRKDDVERTPRKEDRQSRQTGSLGGASDFGVADPIDGVIAAMDYDDVVMERSISALSTSVPNYSTGTACPGIPHSPSMESLPGAQSRRMRRFRSGTVPKTLILPSAAAIPSSGYNNARGFFSPPASECDQISRPASACSIRSGVSLPMSDYPTSDYGALTLANINSHDESSGMGSLFAELSRADHNMDSISMSGTTNLSDSIPHTPASHATRPPSPSLSDAFSLLPDSLTHNQSIKVLDTIPDPAVAAFSYGKRSVSMSNHYTTPITVRTKGLAPPTPVSMHRSHSTSSLAPPSYTQEPQHHMCHACGALNSITPANNITKRRSLLSLRDSARPTASVASSHATRRQANRNRSRTPVPRNRHRALSISFGAEGVDDAVDAIWLWIRFIIAVVVALGLAVKEGPQVVITDSGKITNEEMDAIDHIREEERDRALKRLEGSARGEYWIED